MSTDKQVYPLYYEAKNDKVRKRLGIKGGFYWAEAKKLSIAISRGAVAIDDAGYDEDDFKKPVRVNLPVVDDLPPEGVFDTEFCNRYEKGGEDGITMVFIAPSSSAQDKPASTDNTNVNGEDMTEIEENMLLPISGQELPIRWLAQHGSEKPVTHVSRDELQALHIARAEELPAVTALAVSHKTSLLDPLEIRDLHKLVRDTDRVFPNPGNSSLGLMTAFFEAYLDADYTDRGLLTKEWMKGNRVSRITRTASGANAGGGNLTDRGEGFVHDLTSLARDVATGVLARSMDVDIYNLHPAHAKRAEEIIAENKPPFSVFRDKFITMPGGLDYSRAIVVASVKEAPIGIEVIPAHVTEYLNKVLIETDHANPDPEIVDIACGRSSAPMPQRVTEEGKHDGEEKPQPSCAMADKQATAETVEPDATEHHQDTQPLDAQSQVNSVDAKYQKLRAELHEARKTIPPKNPVDADKLLAASRGEFVEGISDPNDPKWVKGIETRDSVNQNQPESEQNSPNAQKNEPETKQSEPVAQQEPEKVCAACGQSGGGNCPDCGAVMGDTTYQETFNEENLDESQEKDPEEMEGPEHPHNENAGSDPHRDCSDETGEVADPVIAGDIEPGIYYGISNENYHAGPGVSKSQLDDIADTPALYLWRKNAPVDTTKTKTLDLGTAFHCRVLEPEEFSNRFIVAPEFNRRTTAGKEEEKAFLMECASTGKTVITAEEGRKIELMYQSVMALPLGQWLVESAGHAESSIYWEDPETGILCRCRPDKIIPEFHWIMDVKTTADIQRFKTAYYDYRYHVQDAFYSDGYEAQFGVLPTFVFLVASTTVECGRYPVEIFMMGEEAKLAGQQEYHRNLRTLADCLNTDEWPAIKTLSLPRWAKEYAND
ncbi:exodeoxyribonuclease VIII [Escherichia albertii]|uniref:exodeoxyribonuclease VIII n=1 Tax=Escherichia albertii TaxID=208962 RepID=UPI0021E861C5|nr:exodeoxyribonuclease VIII [Escherichia albertii]MCV3220509.1 exodeoxyribonuclease VIII [Escherichia albertii]MCV3224980.1 exodeoxyribonuclease VIII [Escherichia albertii]MCV3236636.1 exodeoxyribonuclease VIII [Escherichia albertii]MCV3247034.1 exodeoxyribonuclease VIII [Escherichia albertii]MCV3260712.1 exodeoxyribonuclease VIII [Escherichia albertii]